MVTPEWRECEELGECRTELILCAAKPVRMCTSWERWCDATGAQRFYHQQPQQKGAEMHGIRGILWSSANSRDISSQQHLNPTEQMWKRICRDKNSMGTVTHDFEFRQLRVRLTAALSLLMGRWGQFWRKWPASPQYKHSLWDLRRSFPPQWACSG